VTGFLRTRATRVIGPAMTSTTDSAIMSLYGTRLSLIFGAAAAHFWP
jgi:hypothetical protein